MNSLGGTVRRPRRAGGIRSIWGRGRARGADRAARQREAVRCGGIGGGGIGGGGGGRRGRDFREALQEGEAGGIDVADPFPRRGGRASVQVAVPGEVFEKRPFDRRILLPLWPWDRLGAALQAGWGDDGPGDDHNWYSWRA